MANSVKLGLDMGEDPGASQQNDVIFALSSGQGRAGVAVIRVSGTSPGFLPKPVRPRVATLMNFYGIDQVIVIYFKAPHSFNGEDMVEIHCHGGRAIINAIFAKLCKFGFRIAERGEFLRRAFDNRKFDLVEVDGIRAMIDAKTERQRAAAMRSMSGQDSHILNGWRNEMIALSALASARMDYDSTDLPGNIDQRIKDGAMTLSEKISTALNSKSCIIENGFNIVLTGKTNVGKSSLFNRLIGENRAIVSEIHGTTRDVVMAEIDIDGFLVRITDTAGIRESTDEIEKIGIEKTRAELEKADLILHVFDTSTNYAPNENGIIVINKSDILKDEIAPKDKHVMVSAKTGAGISELMQIVHARLCEIADTSDDNLTITTRMRANMANVVTELDKVVQVGIELQAEHIMAAADEISMVLGLIGIEEIYDSVFGQLCLGK